MIIAYFDGFCGPTNPNGHGTCGCLIKHDNRTILKKGYYIGFGEGMNNNVSEYVGFIEILKFLKKKNLNQENILIKGDNRMVIEQMKGNWRIKKGTYVSKAIEAKELLKDFSDLKLEWIPREENEVCDELAENAIIKRRIKK